jgi:methyl-accepting chemotaxis protein
MGLDNLSLKAKSIIPLALTATLFAGVVGLSARSVSEVADRYVDLTTKSAPGVIAVLRATRTVALLTVDGLLLQSLECSKADAARCDAVLKAAQVHETLARGFFDEAIDVDPSRRTEFDGYKQLLGQFLADLKPALAGGMVDDPATGAAMNRLAAKLMIFTADIAESNKRAEDRNQVAVTELVAASARNLWMMIGLAALAVAFGVAVSLWMSVVKVSRPLQGLAAAMRRLAERDLTVAVTGQERLDEIGAMAKTVQVFKDSAIKTVAMEAEIAATRTVTERDQARVAAIQASEAAEDQTAIAALAQGLDALANGNLTHQINEAMAPKTQRLKDDFNLTAERLRTTMVTITGAISAMMAGSGEISKAADDLSRRTEVQAASLEQTAAALDEITATVNKTAQGARHAKEVVAAAQQGAHKSGAVVQETVAAMSAIEESAQQISQIIGVIDEIAFQTNLLALNAGVEAARAGEAGRGFAVVASEVRALAQRSAGAAKEIKALISTSTQQVGRGVELVGATGRSLTDIVSQVAQISSVVAEIAASAQEQAAGLAEVNVAINQMDQVTQQNAAMVEQSTAASHSLTQETVELERLTGHFQLGHQAARPSHAAAPRAVKRPVLKVVSQQAPAAPAASAEAWEEF